MITHNEILTGIYAGCAGVVWFLGWWSRGPRAKSLDRAWDQGYGIGHDEGYTSGYAIGVDDQARGLAHVYDEDGGEPQSSFKNVPRPDERPSGSEVAGPGRYPDGREFPTETGTVNAELAALGAQIDAEPSEPIAARLDETSEQWAARMDMEAAIWCAENGVERETAGSRA